jgi:hypothetical protein
MTDQGMDPGSRTNYQDNKERKQKPKQLQTNSRIFRTVETKKQQENKNSC